MRTTHLFFLTTAVAVLTSGAIRAQDKPAAKIKALYLTGGGYHDYQALTPVITQGIDKFANVEWNVQAGPDAWKDSKLADGADAIVFNICYAKATDKDLIENWLKLTRAGRPTVMVHCSMHTFQASDDWTECCGMRTRVHDKYEPFTILKAAADNPIVKFLPDRWETPGDELYQTIQLPETSTVLLKATSPASGKEHVVAWTHTYGKGRVFGTTLGHDMKTVAQADYLHLLANGLLWACDKLDKEGQPATGYGPVATKK